MTPMMRGSPLAELLRRCRPRRSSAARKLLVAVRVTDVDHQLRQQARVLRAARAARRTESAVEVRTSAAATQDDVTILVARRREDRRMSLFRHRQKDVRMPRRFDRVHRDLHRPVGAVLESDRTRQSRRELAMDLTLGRSRADRAPADEVAEVLRRDRVEILGAGSDALRRSAHRSRPRAVCSPRLMSYELFRCGSLINPFQPIGRARFFEIDAHDDLQCVLIRRDLFGEALRVFERRRRIVDRARSDHDDQARIAAMNDVAERRGAS